MRQQSIERTVRYAASRGTTVQGAAREGEVGRRLQPVDCQNVVSKSVDVKVFPCKWERVGSHAARPKFGMDGTEWATGLGPINYPMMLWRSARPGTTQAMVSGRCDSMRPAAVKALAKAGLVHCESMVHLCATFVDSSLLAVCS